MEQDLTQLSYRELQKLAKAHGIRSNQKTLVLIEKLSTLLTNGNDSENLPPDNVQQHSTVASENTTDKDKEKMTPKTEKRKIETELASPKQIHHAPHTSALRRKEEAIAMVNSLPQQRVDSVVRAVASLQDRRGSNIAEIVRYLESTVGGCATAFRSSNISAEVGTALNEAIRVRKLTIKSKYAVGGVRYAIARSQTTPRSSGKRLRNGRSSSASRRVAGMVERRRLLREATAACSSPLRTPLGLGKAKAQSRITSRANNIREPVTPQIQKMTNKTGERRAQTCVKEQFLQNSSVEKRGKPVSSKLRQAMMVERLKRRRAKNTAVQQCRSDIIVRNVSRRFRDLSLDLQDSSSGFRPSTVVRGLDFNSGLCDSKSETYRIPAGWSKRESRSHPGKFYFVNESTMETSWVLPSAT